MTLSGMGSDGISTHRSQSQGAKKRKAVVYELRNQTYKIKNLITTNKIKPLIKDYQAYQGKFVEEAKVDLVLDDFSQLKRPESPFKHIKFQENKHTYSNIVKVGSKGEKPEREDFMSLNQWKKQMLVKNIV